MKSNEIYIVFQKFKIISIPKENHFRSFDKTNSRTPVLPEIQLPIVPDARSKIAKCHECVAT